MFFRKQKLIDSLNKQVIAQDKVIAEKDEIITELKQKIRGDRVCDYYCSECEYSYQSGFYYGCLLDCKCKDFKRG